MAPGTSAAAEMPSTEATGQAGLTAGAAAFASSATETRGSAAFLDWLEALLLPSEILEAQVREAGQRHGWNGGFLRHAAQLIVAFLVRVSIRPPNTPSRA